MMNGSGTELISGATNDVNGEWMLLYSSILKEVYIMNPIQIMWDVFVWVYSFINMFLQYNKALIMHYA